MYIELSDREWHTLCSLLGATPVDRMARNAVSACLFRYDHRLAANYRTFGWTQLPDSFGISGKAAQKRLKKWTTTGVWFTFWDALMQTRSGVAKPGRVIRKPLLAANPVVPLINELQRAYAFFNHRFMGRSLPDNLAITVEGVQTNRSARRGYLSGSPWHDELHHIALLPSRLGNSTDAMATLLHEMAHLRNQALGIEDTNPNTQYHTLDFCATAELLGLICGPRNASRGFALTRLGPRALEAIAQLQPSEDVFTRNGLTLAPKAPG
jgi:hypothetical protein